ncbi:MAG: hypothetical protein K6U80_19840 [Firmicutes bacterium]|nr:hypothetical protein [Bacillota bacterium]
MKLKVITILLPVTTIPGVILALALCGIVVLVDCRTAGKYEWYSRAVNIFIVIVCIIWPGAWGVNELFYGATLQALRLPDWTGRGMKLIDEALIWVSDL